MCLEDVLEFLNQLRRKLLLRQVIVTLHNHQYDTIVRYLSIDTLLLRLATSLSVCLGSKQTLGLLRRELLVLLRHLLVEVRVRLAEETMRKGSSRGETSVASGLLKLEIR